MQAFFAVNALCVTVSSDEACCSTVKTTFAVDVPCVIVSFDEFCTSMLFDEAVDQTQPAAPVAMDGMVG